MKNKPFFAVIPAIVGTLAFFLSMTEIPGDTARERLHTYNTTTSMHAKDAYLTNLGPTGARGWIYANRIYVHEIEPGSPADGRLQSGDFLLGAGGNEFPLNDPRPILGAAIAEAEAADGELVLQVGNQADRRTVRLQLESFERRSETWPYDCRKSAVIRDKALQWMRKNQNPDGSFGMSIYSSLASLFLLSSPAPEDREAARRCIYNRLDGPPADALSSWSYGYSALALAEYYLATGDSVVLPRLEYYAEGIVNGQTASGGWCHNMVKHGVPSGYGELNSAGVVCFLSLVLMRECGIDVDRAALAKAAGFFGRHAGLGCIPYGDHKPGLTTSRVLRSASNGKDATAAVAFHILGDQERARAFAESTARESPYIEDAHTGSYWGVLWLPLGARLAHYAGDFHAAMNENNWYYELMRRWDGGLEYLPNPENLTGFTSFRGGPLTATGAFGLTYSMPWKSLVVMGADPGPFARNGDPALKPAVELFRQKQWKAFDEWMAEWNDNPAPGLEARRQAEQLRGKRVALQNQIDWTLAAVEEQAGKNTLTRTDKNRAVAMLEAAERLWGDQIEATEALRRRLDDVRTASADNRHDRRRTRTDSFNWRPLLPLAGQIDNQSAAKNWRVHSWTGDISPILDNLEPAGEGFKGWYLPEFEVAEWQTVEAPFRTHRRHPDATFEGYPSSLVSHHDAMYQPRPLYNALARTDFTVDDVRDIKGARIVIQNGHQYLRSEVFLNGYRVAAILRPQACELTPEALELLRQGENTLAVFLSSNRGHLHDFDFGIEVR